MCSKNEYTKSESNSQLIAYSFYEGLDCVQRTNIQNLKAIHNSIKVNFWSSCIVFKERIYKIWKQFTTNLQKRSWLKWLCSKNEYTKSESNSQPTVLLLWYLQHCVQRTNIQNLKAIHNQVAWCRGNEAIVFKERIYKIWKQFTTSRFWVA